MPIILSANNKLGNQITVIYSVIIVNVLQVILEASFSSGSAASVAIDRVYVEDGQCSDGNDFFTMSHH